MDLDYLDGDAMMSHPINAGFAELSTHEPGDTLPFYRAEGEVLELWDQLQELKLEQALLEAQINLKSEQSATDEVTQQQVKDAEKEHVEARAAYQLRQSVVEDVLMADPILKAVHAGPNATSTERILHPLIDRRDALGIAQTNISSSLQSVLRDTMKVEAQSLRAIEEIKGLTATYRDLFWKMQGLRDNATRVEGVKKQMEQAKESTRIARDRWRIMKSVVGATVAGSGVEWARDDALRGLVLDGEDEVD